MNLQRLPGGEKIHDQALALYLYWTLLIRLGDWQCVALHQQQVTFGHLVLALGLWWTLLVLLGD
jgi:hypothetical protein